MLWEVEKYFAKTTTPTVSRVTADTQPWGLPLAEGLDPITLKPHTKNDGEKMADRFTREIYNNNLAKLPGIKAPGDDGIPNEILKGLPTEFHDSLFLLFQTLWDQRSTPALWKKAMVILLYKKRRTR